jgi:hypothetical protein
MATLTCIPPHNQFCPRAHQFTLFLATQSFAMDKVSVKDFLVETRATLSLLPFQHFLGMDNFYHHFLP